MKLRLLVLFVFAVVFAAADPIVTVQISSGNPNGPSVLQAPGSPFVLVMVYESTPTAYYTITLPYVDKSGESKTITKSFAASSDGPNTACVFDVDAVTVGSPSVSEIVLVRSKALSKK